MGNKHRGKQRKQGRKPPRRKDAQQKLQDVNNLMDRIIGFVRQGKRARADQQLDFLRENSRDRPDLLAKSLCNLAKQIPQPEWKLDLYREAEEFNPSDPVTLNSYATALANVGERERAFELFERSLELKDTETVTLTSYATALANVGERERAFELFERSLAIDPNNKITLLQFGLFLETQDRCDEAIGYLEKIPLAEIDRRQAGFVCLNLGRLCYQTNQGHKAEEWFDQAVEYSNDAIATKLNAARHILALKPYSREAVARLKEIVRENTRP
uniref:Tetratricopeptide repeat-containing protein n=1 Tax=Candidatus Kentrum sp. TUN TaxID=2126343 RepID=A0A450ZM63_9GAMM|nr:MAG: Tetratricopeptide repeat-containing protein [Candidatus Kentron sp. TUN]